MFAAEFRKYVSQQECLTEFEPWFQRDANLAWELATLALIRHRIIAAAGNNQDLAVIWDDLCKARRIKDQQQLRALVLALVALTYDRSVLIRSNELISRPWVQGEVRDCGTYDPDEKTEQRGLSLVISYDMPKTLIRTIDSCFEGSGFVKTSQAHMTVVSVSELAPKQEIYALRESFIKSWYDAIKEPGFSTCFEGLAAGPDVCADEPRLQGEALVLFASTNRDFVRTMFEARLRLMRGILLEVKSPQRRKQPLWTHTVLGRKTRRTEQAMKLPAWPFRSKTRIRLENSRLALMIYRDSKAFLTPEETIDLPL